MGKGSGETCAETPSGTASQSSFRKTSHQDYHVHSQTKNSLKKEGGQVSGAERYAIWLCRIRCATYKMPLQSVLCSIDLSNDRAGFGSLKLGEHRKAAQITYNVLVVIA